MQDIFNQLINGFIEHKIGTAENFLSTELVQSLQKNLNLLFEAKMMKSAGIGNQTLATHNQLIRSDVIFWLDRSHNDTIENDFFDVMDAFVLHLNNTCYTGIKSYEFHYALYEKGSFYAKHLDQFKSDDSRKYSMIMYLNDDWTGTDGGELCVHHQNESAQLIAPIGGTSVFFQSNELLHEVLVTNKPRMSITGWLKV